jgi:hypothetical protein
MARPASFTVPFTMTFAMMEGAESLLEERFRCGLAKMQATLVDICEPILFGGGSVKVHKTGNNTNEGGNPNEAEKRHVVERKKNSQSQVRSDRGTSLRNAVDI